jgi:hypothetical protein
MRRVEHSRKKRDPEITPERARQGSRNRRGLMVLLAPLLLAGLAALILFVIFYAVPPRP